MGGYIAILFGVVALLIEAYRNFNSQTNSHPFSLHPILNKVEVKHLCTSGEIAAGFAFYFSFYLIAYTLILGSTLVFELLASTSIYKNQLANADQTVLGYLDPSFSPASDFSKPILVSAAMISLLSVGAVKTIEETMRSIAHRLAGVPRGVYRVIGSLWEQQYLELAEKEPGILSIKFERAMRPLKDGVLQPLSLNIAASLAAIDCLSTATTERSREIFFPLFHMAELSGLSKELDAQIDSLGKLLDKLAQLTEPLQVQAAGDGQLEKGVESVVAAAADLLGSIATEAARVRSSVMAVFAVLYVRNNRSISGQNSLRKIADDGNSEGRAQLRPIEKVALGIQEEYNAEQNYFGLSVIVSVIAGGILIYALYFAVARFSGNGGQQTDFYAVLMENTIWDTLTSASLVLLSSAIVLAGREVRIEQQSWRAEWSMHRYPFLKYGAMSVISGVLAVAAVAITAFVQLLLQTDFHPTESQIRFLFEENIWYYVLQFVLGLILGFACLTIMDAHDQLSARSTILLALAFSAIFFLAAVLIILMTYGTASSMTKLLVFRDAMVLSAVPLVFMVCFGCALEWSERGRSPAVAPAAGRAPAV